MSEETKKLSEVAPPGSKSSRREVLKRLVIGLGAAALIQPAGGIFGQEAEKKKTTKPKTTKPSTTTSTSTKKKKKKSTTTSTTTKKKPTKNKGKKKTEGEVKKP